MIWSPAATRQLAAVGRYLEAEAGPATAYRVRNDLRGAAARQSDFPYIGRATSGATRVLVSVAPYLIRYRVTADHVLIVGVRHGAQRPLD